MKYFESLTPNDREVLFAKMRDLDAEAQRYDREHRRLSPPYGAIPVGSAHFDPFLRSYVAQSYLSALRQGQTPQDALTTAKEEAREAVRIHNKKRKDINWARDESSADAYIETIHRRFA